jgi:hypothetical protein
MNHHINPQKTEISPSSNGTFRAGHALLEVRQLLGDGFGARVLLGVQVLETNPGRNQTWPIYRRFTWVYLLKMVIFHGYVK